MAEFFNLEINVDISDSQLGGFSISPPVVSSSTPKFAVTRVNLQNGDNIITIPSGASYALVEFDPGSGTTKKLKGAGGDTGLTLNLPICPLLLPVSSGTFIINSSALDGALITKITFF